MLFVIFIFFSDRPIQVLYPAVGRRSKKRCEISYTLCTYAYHTSCIICTVFIFFNKRSDLVAFGKPDCSSFTPESSRIVTGKRSMHSLKELRAENEAKRLGTTSRTADEDDVATTASAVPAAAPAAVAAATAPRAGRTLAPITSTGSLISSSPAAAPAEPTQRLEDREARRRRRLRRRREREQRDSDNDDDNSKVNVDDNATAVSFASRGSSTPGEEVRGGGEAVARVAAADAAEEENDGVQHSRLGSDSERKSRQIEAGSSHRQQTPAAEDKVVNNDKKRSAATDDDHDDFEETQIGSRGAPPREKPKKKLTPLEARRARIEQHKREEVGVTAYDDRQKRYTIS